MAIKNVLLKAINELCPIINAFNANNNLRRQIEQLENMAENSEYTNKFSRIGVEDVNRLYKTYTGYRKSLIDKAKTNVFSITVAVSFIIGMCNVFSSMVCSQNHLIFFICALAFVFIALIYLLAGGICSLNALQGQRTYDLTPDDFQYFKTLTSATALQERVYSIARNNELNSKIDIIINNLISASYSFIRNGLISLLIAACLIGFLSYQKVKAKQGMDAALLNGIELNKIAFCDSLNVLHNDIDQQFSTQSILIDTNTANLRLRIDSLFAAKTKNINSKPVSAQPQATK